MLTGSKKNALESLGENVSALGGNDDAETPRDGERNPKVYWLDAHTLAIDWFDRVTEDKCIVALINARRLTEGRPPLRFYSDTTGAGSYDVSIRRGATEILKLVRGYGVKEFVAVIDSAAIRMFASTMAFVTGIRLHQFAKRDEALQFLKQHPVAN